LYLNESRRYEKAWKEVTAKELADSLGFDFSDVEEKQISAAKKGIFTTWLCYHFRC
jgi:hypothetical protein